jgi:hypothetical protein
VSPTFDALQQAANVVERHAWTRPSQVPRFHFELTAWTTLLGLEQTTPQHLVESFLERLAGASCPGQQLRGHVFFKRDSGTHRAP